MHPEPQTAPKGAASGAPSPSPPSLALSHLAGWDTSCSPTSPLRPLAPRNPLTKPRSPILAPLCPPAQPSVPRTPWHCPRFVPAVRREENNPSWLPAMPCPASPRPPAPPSWPCTRRRRAIPGRKARAWSRRRSWAKSTIRWLMLSLTLALSERRKAGAIVTLHEDTGTRGHGCQRGWERGQNPVPERPPRPCTSAGRGAGGGGCPRDHPPSVGARWG